MVLGKWWQREDRARGRYAPRLWPVWLAAPLWVAAASLMAWIIYLRLRAVAVPRPGPNGAPPSIDPLDVIKTTIAVAGFIGAVLVGVYAYRKQRLVEGDAHRADAKQLAQRYTTAAEQLGHEKAAVRLAGVYAMARLADDWDEQRQVCIDVLCAYLRMPYEPDPAREKQHEGEREVRHTIIRLIRDHLQDPRVPTTWCGRHLDFTNATFNGGDFSGAEFSGGEVAFYGAKFIGGRVAFHGAKFTGGEVGFHGAKFIGGEVSFYRAEFTGGDLFFGGAEFGGSRVSFDDAKFAAGRVSIGAKFTGGGVSFNAKFTGGEVSFLGAEFAGGAVAFGAEFGGGTVSYGAKFVGGEVGFPAAKFTTDCNIIWGPFEAPAAWTELQERERQQNGPPR